MAAQSFMWFAKREGPNPVLERAVDPAVEAQVNVSPALIDELRHSERQHYARLFTFLMLYFAATFLACRIAQASGGSAWIYLANLPLYLLAAASLHGISLFTHEGIHGTLSVRRWWN